MEENRQAIWEVIKYILGILLTGFFIYGIYLIINQQKEIEKLNQNILADSTSIIKLIQDKDILYSRYAYVLNLKDSTLKVLKKRDEQILTLTKTTIELRHLLSVVQGNYDTVYTDINCFGRKIFFADSNNVFSYKDTVYIEKQPYQKLSFKLNPFNVYSYIARDKQGKWSGVIKFDEYMNEYMSVSNMDVFITDDLFEDNTSVSALMIGGSLGAVYYDNKIILGVGVSTLFKEKHFIQYKYGIGASAHFLDYSYLIDLGKIF